MKQFKFWGVLLIGLSLSACASMFSGTQTRNNESKREYLIFMYETDVDVYHEIESIAIVKGATSGFATYTVDRFSGKTQTLVTLQMGNFNITENSIVIKTNASNFEGTIYEDKIVIGDKEYLLSEN
jgi:hypothetical protein